MVGGAVRGGGAVTAWWIALMALGLAAPFLATLIGCAPPRPVPGQGPAIKVDREVWDFGTIERGDTVRTSLAVANAGSDSLRLAASITCDCLTASWERTVLPPRGSTEIALAMVGYEIKDATSKTLFLDSNDQSRPRVAITATGRVVRGRRPHLVATPSPLPIEQWHGELRIENQGREDLVIADVRCFGCGSDWSRLVLPAGRDSILHVDAIPQWPDGRWIEIDSNDPVLPLRKISLVTM
ncbi:MAG: DUF1573 domain-containing protein [bacterium]